MNPGADTEFFHCCRCEIYIATHGNLCEVCAEIAAEVVAAYRAGQRVFWRFAANGSDEPSSFTVERVDASRLLADFAAKPYNHGWLKYSAFVSRNAALLYRIDLLDAEDRGHADAIDDEHRRHAAAIDALRRARNDRFVRRQRLAAQMALDPSFEPAFDIVPPTPS